MTDPTTFGAAPAATPRPTNPYSFTGPGYRDQHPQVPPQEQAVFQQQPFQQQSGGIFMGQGYSSFQPQLNYGIGQNPTPYCGGTWQDGSSGYRQPVQFPATPIPVQHYQIQAACSWASNCWPELPGDRVPGVFSISQTGEILTIRSPKEGEEWMRANPQEDQQRWGLLNSTMTVLAKTTPDRMMLDQLEALVQPTQFLEHLRKTMPMTEGQLDMVSAMHEAMFRQLNALEMLHKGGQRAVDEFLSSGLHGLEKRKANALQ
jgi:hypothetical protein